MDIILKIRFVPVFSLYDPGLKPCLNLLMGVMRQLLSFYIWECFKQPSSERLLSQHLTVFQLRQHVRKISSRSKVLQ